jgi:flagellar hook-associated protein 2
MAGISMGTGLASGIDYSTMITQLMQIEAQPQTLLSNQLTATRTAAKAYRQINTALAGLSSAAQALTPATAWTAAKATSSSTTVSASATAGASAGTLTFTVNQLAAAHAVISTQTWSSTTAVPTPAPGALTITKGTTPKTIDTGSGSLADTIAGINKSGLGLTASAVKTGTNTYRLQVSATTTGQASLFSLSYGGTNDSTVVTQAADATITVGGTNGVGGYTATSTTNTFADVLAGSSFTVSQKDATATITVGSDTGAITTLVQNLVTAANTALTAIGSATDSTAGSDAPLKGNWTLTNLASQILDQVSRAVGATSPAKAGLQLNSDGTLKFTAATFTSALTADPGLVQKIFQGRTGPGTDNVDHTPDDSIDVDGIAARLSVLAERASDSATGMITSLANSQDSRAKDLQSQIDAWDLRLASRKATLTAQFNAMETALGTLQNQSTWLTSQIASLPTGSSSKS